MIKVDNRESAHIRSRVKDLSYVPNVASFNGLFAAITPIAKVAKNEEDGTYEPILIRDNETLISNFGDPRIDPEKYIDLYSIMKLVGNGGTCYLAKVNSGNAGTYHFPFLADPVRSDDTADQVQFREFTRVGETNAYSISGLNNKYIITGVKGYSDSPQPTPTTPFIFYTQPFAVVGDDMSRPSNNDSNHSGLPSTEVADYTGHYTWECVQDGNTFTLSITLDEALPGGQKLVAFGTVDPAWGSEPIQVSPVLEPKMNGDEQAKDGEGNLLWESVAVDNTVDGVLKVTFTSDNEFEHEYIWLKSGHELFKSAFAAGYTPSGASEPTVVIPSIESYSLVGGKFTAVIAYTYDNPSDKSALDSAVKGSFINSSTTGSAEDGYIKSDFKVTVLEGLTRHDHAMIAYSSMTEDLAFKVYLSQAKPFSVHAYYLNVEVTNNDETNTLGAAKIKLDSTVTNQGLVNNLNSALGTVIQFELLDKSTAGACGVKERGANSIVQALLDTYCGGGVDKLEPNPQPLAQPIVIDPPSFKVTVNDYIAALKQYKDRKYAGCLMADMTCPVTNDLNEDTGAVDEEHTHTLYPLSSSDRRTLHYNMKDIAYERKDTTVILSTPYTKSHKDITAFTTQNACEWVSSTGEYNQLWEYGQGATTDYATQSFYLEMYFSWLEMQCDWIVNGVAKSKPVKVAPADLVINNVLTSWRERGVQYPVAGDQGGVLPETCKVLYNPKTKPERDQLVQYRINPIWDTGTRGVQIFGNETLNAGYTDLNAAHIARTLVYIRSRIDEYTEKLKFSINNLLLWDKWKTYVSQYILEPLRSVNALSEYRIAMGEDTTSKAEIANRQINGVVQLIFFQSAEVFDLTYVVYSSSTTIEEAMNNT